jgi:iron complex transport system ATP-binding protein
MGRAPHQLGWLRASPRDEAIVAETLAACELEALADRPVEALSGGEQQRVNVARALAQEAPVLLLDEAAAHLDARHALGSFALVRERVRERGIACLAAMHDLSAAARFADRAVLLRDGRLLAAGPVGEVMTPENLEASLGVGFELLRTARGELVFVPTDTRPSAAIDL